MADGTFEAGRPVAPESTSPRRRCRYLWRFAVPMPAAAVLVELAPTLLPLDHLQPPRGRRPQERRSRGKVGSPRIDKPAILSLIAQLVLEALRRGVDDVRHIGDLVREILKKREPEPAPAPSGEPL